MNPVTPLFISSYIHHNRQDIAKSNTFYSVFIVHCMYMSVRLFFLLFYIWTLSSKRNELNWIEKN